MRADKKIDIRIPINRDDKKFVFWESKMRRQSMTEYCTDLVKAHLETQNHFPIQEYKLSLNWVHVKVQQQTYEQLVYYANEWGCSIREATHRIFTDALFKERGGVYVYSYLK